MVNRKQSGLLVLIVGLMAASPFLACAFATRLPGTAAPSIIRQIAAQSHCRNQNANPHRDASGLGGMCASFRISSIRS